MAVSSVGYADRFPVIACVLVRFSDGTLCWVPFNDYRTNPTPGSYIITDHRRFKFEDLRK